MACARGDFFEHLTRTHNLVAALRWTPLEMMNVVGSVSFARHYSTYPPLNRRAVNIAPSLLLQFKYQSTFALDEVGPTPRAIPPITIPL